MFYPRAGMRPDPKHPHMENLVAWYPMLHGGLTEYDISGNGLHGTYSFGVGNAPNLLEENGGAPTPFAREFNAASDGLYTQVPAFTEYTFSCFMMRPSFAPGAQVLMQLNHPTDAFRRYLLGSAIAGFIGNSFEHTSAAWGWLGGVDQLEHQWYHIFFRRAGNGVANGYTLIVDGEQFESKNCGTFNIDGCDNFSIGAAYSGGWTGTPWGAGCGIANVRFWNKALDNQVATEITRNPWAPFFPNRPEPVPFPATGLTAVRWGPVGRGRIRSGNDLGTHRIVGAP